MLTTKKQDKRGGTEGTQPDRSTLRLQREQLDAKMAELRRQVAGRDGSRQAGRNSQA